MNIKSALLILASTALTLPTPPALPSPHTQPSPPTKAKVGIWSNHTDSWNEYGLRRRRVEFSSLGTPAEIFCEWWVDRKDKICEYSNKQCFWDARVETWAAETSWVAGPLGKHQFEKCFEKGMEWWEQKAALHYWEMDTAWFWVPREQCGGNTTLGGQPLRFHDNFKGSMLEDPEYVNFEYNQNECV